MPIFPNQKQITDVWQGKQSGLSATVRSGGKRFELLYFTAVGVEPPSENGANRFGLLKTTHGKTKYVLQNDNKPAFNDANKKVLITHWLGSWGKKQFALSQNFRGFKHQAIKEAKDKFLFNVEKLVPSFSDEAWWRNFYRSVGNLIKIDTEANKAQTFLGYGIENPTEFAIPTALPAALVRANEALKRVDDVETRTDELETAVDELGTELKQFATRFDENGTIVVEMESAINQFASRLLEIETFTHENGTRLDESETRTGANEEAIASVRNEIDALRGVLSELSLSFSAFVANHPNGVNENVAPQQPQKKTIRFHAQTTVALAPVVKSNTGSVEGPTSRVNVSASAFGCPHKGKEHAIEDRKEYPPNAIPLKQRHNSNSNSILRTSAQVKEAREQQHSQDRKREEESERARMNGREERRKDGAFVPPSLSRSD